MTQKVTPLALLEEERMKRKLILNARILDALGGVVDEEPSDKEQDLFVGRVMLIIDDEVAALRSRVEELEKALKESKELIQYSRSFVGKEYTSTKKRMTEFIEQLEKLLTNQK